MGRPCRLRSTRPAQRARQLGRCAAKLDEVLPGEPRQAGQTIELVIDQRQRVMGIVEQPLARLMSRNTPKGPNTQFHASPSTLGDRYEDDSLDGCGVRRGAGLRNCAGPGASAPGMGMGPGMRGGRNHAAIIASG